MGVSCVCPSHKTAQQTPAFRPRKRGTHIGALGKALGHGQDLARQPRVADRVRHLLGVLRFGREGVDVLLGLLPELLPARVVVEVDADGDGAVRLQLDLVRAHAQVPVLEDLGRLGGEEVGLHRQRRLESRAREELDRAGPLDPVDGEADHVLVHELRHLLLAEVAPDEVGEQDGQEVLELPADDLGHLVR